MAPERPETAEAGGERDQLAIRPGYKGFVAFCEAMGEPRRRAVPAAGF